ncbi:unnamed protein product [Leuciscus chuanchicus]
MEPGQEIYTSPLHDNVAPSLGWVTFDGSLSWSGLGVAQEAAKRELPQKQLLVDPCVSIGGNGKCRRGPARGHFQSAALR